MFQNIKQKTKRQKRKRKLKKPKNLINPSRGQQPSINVIERMEVAREDIQEKKDCFLELKDV